jgi:hypothetical protein
VRDNQFSGYAAQPGPIILSGFVGYLRMTLLWLSSCGIVLPHREIEELSGQASENLEALEITPKYGYRAQKIS